MKYNNYITNSFECYALISRHFPKHYFTSVVSCEYLMNNRQFLKRISPLFTPISLTYFVPPERNHTYRDPRHWTEICFVERKSSRVLRLSVQLAKYHEYCVQQPSQWHQGARRGVAACFPSLIELWKIELVLFYVNFSIKF